MNCVNESMEATLKRECLVEEGGLLIGVLFVTLWLSIFPPSAWMGQGVPDVWWAWSCWCAFPACNPFDTRHFDFERGWLFFVRIFPSFDCLSWNETFLVWWVIFWADPPLLTARFWLSSFVERLLENLKNGGKRLAWSQLYFLHHTKQIDFQSSAMNRSDFTVNWLI